VDPLVVLAVLGVGVLVTAVAVLAFGVSERERAAAVPAPAPELPDGVAQVLSVLRSAAIVLDVADGVVRATPAAYAFGLVRDRSVIHPELLTMARGVRRDGLIAERELELPRGPLGRGLFVLSVRVAPLGPLHVLLLAEDRTEARRVDEVRRDFVVNVSHELKTPVGAIALLAETMTAAADDPDAVRRFASRMQRESDRLSALVQEIIDLSRVQGSEGVGTPVLVDVDAVVAEAVDRARLGADAKGISIAVGGAGGTAVYGDASLLVTAVRNLIDNAIRYSEERTRIGIGVRDEGGLVEVVVSDQGIGMPLPEQARIFERFYRIDPARSRATGGTGLGLSIVKHVAANHGGDVTVWSNPGDGSTFTLRLPAAGPTAPAPLGAAATSAPVSTEPWTGGAAGSSGPPAAGSPGSPGQQPPAPIAGPATPRKVTT
jgi:two-component system sensor histidine kinase SenX3